MRLTVVGSGTILPDAQRGSASLHLDVDGHSILIDAGAGTVHGLPRAEVDWRALDTVAVTHFHPDHVSDLAQLLAAFRLEGSGSPLTLIGPVGFAGYLDRLAALHGAWIHEPGRPLVVEEVGEGKDWASSDGRIALEARRTPHTEESVAYVVRSLASGARVGYTGDTGPSGEVADFLAGCQVLVAECSLADPPELDTHLSPSTLAALAERASPELLVVTHVYPPQSPDEAVAALEALYEGRVVAGSDGLAITVATGGVAVDRPRGRA